MIEELHAALRKAFPGGDPAADVDRAVPEPAGWSNRVYRVAHRSGPLVVRIPGADPAGVVDRGNEARAYALAAEAGLAPKPIHLDTATGVLVAPDLGLPDLRAHLRAAPLDAALVQRIGGALARFHALAAGAATAFDPVAGIDQQLAAARERGFDLAPEVLTARASVPHLATDRFVHHDLIPENILVGEQIWLIDLETAGPGDADLDLISLTHALGLDTTTEAMLFEAAQRAPLAAEMRSALLRLYLLKEYAWAAVRIASGRKDAEVRGQLATSTEALKRLQGR